MKKLNPFLIAALVVAFLGICLMGLFLGSFIPEIIHMISAGKIQDQNSLVVLVLGSIAAIVMLLAIAGVFILWQVLYSKGEEK